MTSDPYLTEVLGGVVPDEATPPAPPDRWVVVAMIEDGAIDVVLTTNPDAHGRDGGPPVVVACPADQFTHTALLQALSVWRRDDGLYRYSPPVEALCDGLRALASHSDHDDAKRAASMMVMDVAEWWTSTRG